MSSKDEGFPGLMMWFFIFLLILNPYKRPETSSDIEVLDSEAVPPSVIAMVKPVLFKTHKDKVLTVEVMDTCNSASPIWIDADFLINYMAKERTDGMIRSCAAAISRNGVINQSTCSELTIVKFGTGNYKANLKADEWNMVATPREYYECEKR